jgi:hypothetical protein
MYKFFDNMRSFLANSLFTNSLLQLFMIDNAADDWRIAMTWQRMMQVQRRQAKTADFRIFNDFYRVFCTKNFRFFFVSFDFDIAPVKQCSTNMQQKMLLCKAILHNCG